MRYNEQTIAMASLGMTYYQATILCALAHRDAGEFDAATLAVVSGVPKTSIYENAEQLVHMELIREVSRRPIMWRGYPWRETLAKLHAMVESQARQKHESIERFADMIGPVAK
jgi:sugar-specific transcriptional regulator TrmB